MLRILLSRLQPKINALLSEEQTGFRKNRSTAEQKFHLRMLVEKHLSHKLNVFTTFINFKKVFDRVWHEALWAQSASMQPA